MRLINLIACEWLSHKIDKGKLLNFSTFSAACFFVKFSFMIHVITQLQIRKRTESNQRPVPLTLHETKAKDNQSIQMQSDFKLLD